MTVEAGLWAVTELKSPKGTAVGETFLEVANLCRFPESEGSGFGQSVLWQFHTPLGTVSEQRLLFLVSLACCGGIVHHYKL